MSVWLKAALALAAVWLIAGLGIWWLHATKPTPQSVTAFLDGANLAARTGRDREKIIHRAEDQLNDLTPAERQLLQKNGSTRRFFGALSREEQSAFLDATLPADFKQMMEVFNKMEPAKRKEFVARAVEEMKKTRWRRSPARSGRQPARQDRRSGFEIVLHRRQRRHEDRSRPAHRADAAQHAVRQRKLSECRRQKAESRRQEIRRKAESRWQ